MSPTFWTDVVLDQTIITTRSKGTDFINTELEMMEWKDPEYLKMLKSSKLLILTFVDELCGVDLANKVLKIQTYKVLGRWNQSKPVTDSTWSYNPVDTRQ